VVEFSYNFAGWQACSSLEKLHLYSSYNKHIQNKEKYQQTEILYKRDGLNKIVCLISDRG